MQGTTVLKTLLLLFPLRECWWNIFLRACISKLCICIIYHFNFCRFAPPGPNRRYLNSLTTKVWWSWLVQGVRITTSSRTTSGGSLTSKEKGWLCFETPNQIVLPIYNINRWKKLHWCNNVYIANRYNALLLRVVNTESWALALTSVLLIFFK